jgi:hypothetical protein
MRRCARVFCHGTILRDEFGDYVCALCGRSTAEISRLALVSADKLGDAPRVHVALPSVDPKIQRRRDANAACQMRRRDRQTPEQRDAERCTRLARYERQRVAS